MACNEIYLAITDVMPPSCFYCLVYDCIDDMCQKGYCWLLHEKVLKPLGSRLEKCPLVSANDIVKYTTEDGTVIYRRKEE
jgi:hypothetical protein